MINQVISLLSKLAPVMQKEGPKMLKNVIGHFAKHKDKYIGAGVGVGIGAPVAGGILYEKGKRKGKNDQSQIDAKKMEKIHQEHEKDRKEWKRQRKNYDDFIDDMKRSFID